MNKVILGIFVVLVGLILGTGYKEPEVTIETEEIHVIDIIEPQFFGSMPDDEPMTLERVYTPQEINDEFDIFKPCCYTENELQIALGETRDGLSPYICTFLEAEETNGVNAFYLMCKFGLESGWGKHTSGRNNIAGWRNGDGSYRDFESIDECIFYISERLEERYSDEDASLKDICRSYCSNDGYLEYLLDIMEDCKQRIEEGKAWA